VVRRNTMKNLLFSTAVIGIWAVALLFGQEIDVKMPQDKGSDKIDVSGYPQEMQKRYRLFATKCSKCHTAARAINTTMTKEKWSQSIKRMLDKPSSSTSVEQGRQILEFIMYDEKERKAKNPGAFYGPASADAMREATKEVKSN